MKNIEVFCFFCNFTEYFQLLLSMNNTVKKRKQLHFQMCLIFIASGFIAIVSCTKPDEPADVGYNFFPHSPGHWMHYDVDSTVWDDFTSEVYNYNSQILEIVESAFTDGEGYPALRIERYYRKNDTMQWAIKDVWFANLKPASAEIVEENVRFVKLAFPVKSNNNWNGNAFNYLPAETYSYDNINQSMTAGTQTYDSTVTVNHKETVNLIEEDIRYEVYARNVGMIYKYTKTVEKNIAQPDAIVKGVLIEYTLRNYGPK